MHAWIGFVFSCAMIIVAGMGKSGYHWLPSSLTATPTMEFLFLMGCAGFGAALALLAPNYSTARLASLWSSAALAVVVLVVNIDSHDRRGNTVRNIEPAVVIPGKPDDKKPKLNSVLKTTIHEGEWVPFRDFDHRVREFERSQPSLPENMDTNEPIPPAEPNPRQ